MAALVSDIDVCGFWLRRFSAKAFASLAAMFSFRVRDEGEVKVMARLVARSLGSNEMAPRRDAQSTQIRIGAILLWLFALHIRTQRITKVCVRLDNIDAYLHNLRRAGIPFSLRRRRRRRRFGVVSGHFMMPRVFFMLQSATKKKRVIATAADGAGAQNVRTAPLARF